MPEVTIKLVNKMVALILLSCSQKKIAGRISRGRKGLGLLLNRKPLGFLVELRELSKFLMDLFSLVQEEDQKLLVESILPSKMVETHILK